MLEHADRLIAIGCFSVGTNQVDIDAVRASGIPVFNAPFLQHPQRGELVIGEIVMLLRRIIDRSVAAHEGKWDKSATNSHEVRGKTLGIVGYGNIGSQLSYLAEAMGMRVLYYDHTDKLRHGNTEALSSLHELLAASDVVSLHVPETPATHGMIGAAEIAAIKPGAYFINNSRGTVVDLDALAAALREGRLRGAAVDVFPVEPGSNSERFVTPLQGPAQRHPHPPYRRLDGRGAGAHRGRGGAQDGGLQRQRLHHGRRQLPAGQLPTRPLGTRFIQVQRNVPGMLGRLNEVLARHSVNIAAQYYETHADVGYVVLDVDASAADSQAVLADIRALEGTIRARLLYEYKI